MGDYKDLLPAEKHLFCHSYWVVNQLIDTRDVSFYITTKLIALWYVEHMVRLEDERGQVSRYYREGQTPPWFYKEITKDFAEFHQKEIEESLMKLMNNLGSSYDADYLLIVSTNRVQDGHGMIRLVNSGKFSPDIPGYIILPPLNKYHYVDIRDGPSMGGLFYRKPIPVNVWEALMQRAIEKKMERKRRSSLWSKLEELFHMEGEFIISGFLGSG